LRAFRFWLITGLILVFIAGCTQRETDIGSDALTGVPSDTFAVAQAHATASASFHPRLSNSGSTSLEIGDARGLFVFAAVSFDLATALMDSARGDSLWHVDSVRVRFRRNHSWPEATTERLEIRVREITENWDESDVLPGSFAGRTGYPIFDSLALEVSDTVLTFSIPLPIFAHWLDGDTTSQGILLEPRSGGTFYEFYSSEYYAASFPQHPPAIIIHGTNRHADTTFSVEMPALYDGYVAIDSTELDPQRLYIGQGILQRTALFFPLDSLASNITHSVNRAELHLFADTLNAANIQLASLNVLFKHGYLNDTIWIRQPDTLKSYTSWGFEYSQAGSWANNEEFVLDVSGIIATWIANPKRNDGIQVFSAAETDYLARSVFYSPFATDPSKRPTLYIWYTEYSH
jgi:hypothetical protein